MTPATAPVAMPATEALRAWPPVGLMVEAGGGGGVVVVDDDDDDDDEEYDDALLITLIRVDGVDEDVVVGVA